MKPTTLQLTTSALLLALLIVGAYLRVPTPWGVPLTLQPLALMLIGLLLPVRRATLTVAVYLLAGAIGLPVFSGGAGGVASFAGPTGGFLVGFLLMPAATACSRRSLSVLPWQGGFTRLVLACLGGLVPVFTFGSLWFAHQGGISVGAALRVVVLPFLPGDLLKAFVAATLSTRLQDRVPALAPHTGFDPSSTNASRAATPAV